MAKVMAIQPNGQTFNIRTTITTVAAQHADYQAGNTTTLTLTMLPIDWQLTAGSQLRLDLTSSDFPQYQVHSNYRGNQSEQAQTRLAHQQLVLNKDVPSTLTLPLADA